MSIYTGRVIRLKSHFPWRPGLLAALAGVFLAAPAHPQPAPTDTTIAGQGYTLRSIETLLNQLHQRTSAPITYRHTAFQGRLFAPSTLDTVFARLDFTDVRFLDEVALNHVVFKAAVDWRKAVFENGLSLQHSRFLEHASFSGSRFQQHATLRQTQFHAAVNFSDCRFAAVTSFIEAGFHGNEHLFGRAAFTEAAYFERAHFSGSADFQDASFADIASFKESTWHQDAWFDGGRFGGRLLFWDAQFKAKATFNRARAEGEVAFNRAAFKGPASFERFIFAQQALFIQTVFTDAVSFAGAYFRKAAEFTDSTFGNSLQFNASFNQSLDLRRTHISTLDLHLPEGADSLFAAGARVYLQQANYGNILVRWRSLATHLAAVDTTSSEDLEPVYATLRRHLRMQGLQRDADACFVEWMEHRLRQLTWIDPGFYGLYVLGLTTGFGTAPGRFIGSTVCIVFLCGLLYRLGRAHLGPQHNGPAPSLSACLLFSLMTFIRYPVSTLRPTGPMLLLACLEALLGWICLGLLVALLLTRLS